MTVTIVREPYTLGRALQELVDGRKGTLMMVNQKTQEAYRVVKYDPQTCELRLVAPGGKKFRSLMRPNTGELYRPLWR